MKKGPMSRNSDRIGHYLLLRLQTRKANLYITYTDLIGNHRYNNCAMNQCLTKVSDNK